MAFDRHLRPFQSDKVRFREFGGLCYRLRSLCSVGHLEHDYKDELGYKRLLDRPLYLLFLLRKNSYKRRDGFQLGTLREIFPELNFGGFAIDFGRISM